MKLILLFLGFLSWAYGSSLADLFQTEYGIEQCPIESTEGSLAKGKVFRTVSDCTLCVKAPETLPKTYIGEVLNSTDPNSKRITVLNSNRARSLMTAVRGLKIPLDPQGNSCEARAHKIVKFLESRGVYSAKAFVHGDLKWPGAPAGWSYHVAPVVYVQIGNQLKPMVIDILMDKVNMIPLDEWVTKTVGKGSLDNFHLSTRYSYNSSDAVKQPREKFRMSDECQMKNSLHIDGRSNEAGSVPAGID